MLSLFVLQNYHCGTLSKSSLSKLVQISSKFQLISLCWLGYMVFVQLGEFEQYFHEMLETALKLD